MISDRSIDELREKIDIVEVIQKSMELKKKGATWSGCCPFHGEKTPSFSVSPVKQIFKCFGCGVGGDAISFVMKHENIEFIPALRKLASQYNFEFEEFEETPEEKEAATKKADLWKINAAAARHFQERLFDQLITHWSADMLLDGRKYHPETILEFGIGYSPKAQRDLCEIVTNKGLYFSAEELGLVKTGETGSTYDVFRDRVMFPIHNEQGLVVGFGGRKPTDDKDKDNPKYINSKESILYKKDRVLYGLFQAKKHIREAGFIVIVEGYTDVISMHQAGIQNTVAACGTALTPNHAKLIKRYTNKVILMADGDDAGQKANFKAVDILIAQDLQVFICPLPEEEDPDTFARKHFLSAETI
jgi:DNA primase catalytic core